MKKQMNKNPIIVMIVTLLSLIFIPKMSYGYTSVNLNDYKPQISNNSLIDSDETVSETNKPIISLKSKVISFIFLIIITALIYFVPTIIALVKHHTYKLYIIVINIILGWTLLAWIVCLIWSLIDKK